METSSSARRGGREKSTAGKKHGDDPSTPGGGSGGVGKELLNPLLTGLHLHHLQCRQVPGHLVSGLVKGKLTVRQAPFP